MPVGVLKGFRLGFIPFGRSVLAGCTWFSVIERKQVVCVKIEITCKRYVQCALFCFFSISSTGLNRRHCVSMRKDRRWPGCCGSVKYTRDLFIFAM